MRGMDGMKRDTLPDSKLMVRNMGVGPSRIMVVEPAESDGAKWRPIRIPSCNVILFNGDVDRELGRWFKRSKSRRVRSAKMPGGLPMMRLKNDMG